VKGTVNAQDIGTSAIFQIMPYQNGGSISSSSSPPVEVAAVALFNALNTKANGDVIFSWDYQMSAYGMLNGTSTNLLSVDDVITLVLPFTYDVAFDFGVYASVLTGERAQGASRGTGEVLFDSTVTWLGNLTVFDWNSVDGIIGENSGYSLSTVSGLDYTQSFDASAAEPGTLAAMGVGLLGISWIRRRRTRR
jgi:hypothetical protein